MAFSLFLLTFEHMRIIKNTRLYSILFNKCPRCHKGDFYKPGNPYKLFFEKEPVNKACSACEQPYEPEPGYYYGAMFVSYALNVGVFIAVWLATQLLFPASLSIFEEVVIIGVVLVLIAPLSLYYSKLIWINFFVKKDR